MRSSECLILDASCLLNLYATGRLGEVVLTVGARIEVADYVLEHEAIYTWQTDSTGTREEMVPVDLTPLAEEGLIRAVRLERPDDQSTFVTLAALVDDGEAATGALAFHRGCSVATDDRKARRVFGEFMPDVQLVSTLEFMKIWADESRIPGDELRVAMEKMRDSASYVPSSRDPFFEWWTTVMASED
ncbi:MAG: hypothetical protein OXC95_14625 [Dehalococcoidia bacterium]|nr:hypothetical protein [Dehalococcoidia bacterium]